MNTVRCKMTVETINEDIVPAINPDQDGGALIQKTSEYIMLRAKYTGSPEDNTFSKFTPTAQFTMNITNPDVFGFFKEGEAYYFDITKT